jgi:tetratricopeptide (TPR) repeat protein
MNERDLFAAANAISDPTERAAFLNRECAGRPDLRRQVERLINVPIDSGELLDFLATQPVATLTEVLDSPEPEPKPKSDLPPSIGAVVEERPEPVLATSEPLREDFGEFVWRHQTAAIIGSLAVVALIAAWMANGPDEPRQSQTSAEVDADRALNREAGNAGSRERQRADTAATESTRTDADKQKAVERRGRELEALRATEPDVAKLRHRKALSPEEQERLESLVRRWKVFTERQDDDVESRRLQADAHLRVATLNRILGRRDDEFVELRAACDLLGEVARTDPSAAAGRTELAGAHVDLGSFLAEAGRKEEALAAYKTAVDHQRLLANEFPKDPTNANSLAATLAALGNLFADLDECEQSLEAFREGLDTQKTVVERFPDDPEFQKNLVRMRGSLGIALQRFGKSQEAIEESVVSVDLSKKLVERHPLDADNWNRLAEAHVNLAAMLDESGRMEEALEVSRSALSLRREIARRFPTQAERHCMLGDAHTNVGELLARLKRDSEALKENHAALEVFRALAAEFPTAVAYLERLSLAQLNVGRTLVELRRPDEALERYRASRDVCRLLVERFPGRASHESELGRVHCELLGLLRRLGKGAEARSEYRSALALQEELVERFPGDAGHCIDLAATRCEFASLLLDEGKAVESLREFDQAVALLEPLATRIPPAPLSIERLRDGLWGRARAFASLQKQSRAMRDADRVVELAPENERRGIRAACVNLRLKAGDVERAVADADELTRESTWSAAEWYNFACVYAAACAKLPDKRDRLAASAMDLLHRAAQAGYTDIAHIERDADLDSLRQREDFKAWLANLQAATANVKAAKP